MCMSNLPIEFDEHGDPYLAEEADDVDQPTCGCDDEVALEELDPESAFADIADSVPDDVLEHLEDGPEAADPPTPTGGD